LEFRVEPTFAASFLNFSLSASPNFFQLTAASGDRRTFIEGGEPFIAGGGCLLDGEEPSMDGRVRRPEGGRDAGPDRERPLLVPSRG